mgnify:FL=1
MKEIIIEPHIGIGQLKLGMTSDELENALLQMKKQWSNSSDEAMQMECCAETDDPNLITGRYMDNDSDTWQAEPEAGRLHNSSSPFPVFCPLRADQNHLPQPVHPQI